MPLNLHGFEGVDARDKRGHDESVIMQVGISPRYVRIWPGPEATVMGQRVRWLGSSCHGHVAPKTTRMTRMYGQAANNRSIAAALPNRRRS